jgi:hypothetical protein
MSESTDGGSMTVLGDLICDLNPYTELPQDTTTGLRTGKMQLIMLPQLADPSDPNKKPLIGAIALEVERNYGATWTFKGQAQAVKAAVRIPYRFPVYKNGKLAYWQTESLLIGFAGADGGG